MFPGALQGLHWVTGVGKHLGGRASSQPTSARLSGICQPFRSAFFGSFLPGKHFPVWGTYTSLSLRLLKAHLSANHPPKLVLVLCLPHNTWQATCFVLTLTLRPQLWPLPSGPMLCGTSSSHQDVCLLSVPPPPPIDSWHSRHWKSECRNLPAWILSWTCIVPDPVTISRIV